MLREDCLVGVVGEGACRDGYQPLEAVKRVMLIAAVAPARGEAARAACPKHSAPQYACVWGGTAYKFRLTSYGTCTAGKATQRDRSGHNNVENRATNYANVATSS